MVIWWCPRKSMQGLNPPSFFPKKEKPITHHRLGRKMGGIVLQPMHCPSTSAWPPSQEQTGNRDDHVVLWCLAGGINSAVYHRQWGGSEVAFTLLNTSFRLRYSLGTLGMKKNCSKRTVKLVSAVKVKTVFYRSRLNLMTCACCASWGWHLFCLFGAFLGRTESQPRWVARLSEVRSGIVVGSLGRRRVTRIPH